MTDIVDQATRSRIMSRIRGADTKPELLIRKALHAEGFRFRVNVGRLPGKPDVVLPKWNAAILIHGCFWHRHPGCSKATTPSSNVDFWQQKFAANVERDRRVVARLEELGWRTLTIWECTIGRRVDRLLIDKVKLFLKAGRSSDLRTGLPFRHGEIVSSDTGESKYSLVYRQIDEVSCVCRRCPPKS